MILLIFDVAHQCHLKCYYILSKTLGIQELAHCNVCPISVTLLCH